MNGRRKSLAMFLIELRARIKKIIKIYLRYLRRTDWLAKKNSSPRLLLQKMYLATIFCIKMITHITKAILRDIQWEQDENGKPYPDWKKKKLGEISVIKTGKKDANIAKSDGKYRFYTCSRDYLHADVYSFEGEAILVAGNADVGLCHYYNGKFEAYQRTYVLQNFKTDGKYLYKYLSHFFRQYVLRLMQSSAMTYITLGTLENFTVPLPSEKEQQKIADFLTTLDDKITVEKSKLTAAKQFKKALLQRMFV